MSNYIEFNLPTADVQTIVHTEKRYYRAPFKSAYCELDADDLHSTAIRNGHHYFAPGTRKYFRAKISGGYQVSPHVVICSESVQCTGFAREYRILICVANGFGDFSVSRIESTQSTVAKQRDTMQRDFMQALKSGYSEANALAMVCKVTISPTAPALVPLETIGA